MFYANIPFWGCSPNTWDRRSSVKQRGPTVQVMWHAASPRIKHLLPLWCGHFYLIVLKETIINRNSSGRNQTFLEFDWFWTSLATRGWGGAKPPTPHKDMGIYIYIGFLVIVPFFLGTGINEKSLCVVGRNFTCDVWNMFLTRFSQVVASTFFSLIYCCSDSYVCISTYGGFSLMPVPRKQRWNKYIYIIYIYIILGGASPPDPPPPPGS